MSTSDHPIAGDEHTHHPEAEHRHDGHVHLLVAKTPTAVKASWDSARWAVVALGLVGAGLVVGSYFFDWWRFWLYAPQYPGGLRLAISLTGVTGDVREVDILNHYIGMQSLANAAPTERRLASYGVAAIAAISLAGALFAGKKLNKLIAIPAALFPIIFIADAFYWLYRFGHELDPRAPLDIGVFTPQMFGNGEIGQFATFAAPAMGFWLAVAGFVALAVGTLLRRKVCDSCGRASTCGTACPRLMLLPNQKPT
jgi:copper chaperone NosL